MRSPSAWPLLAVLGLGFTPSAMLAQGIQWRQNYAAARQEAVQQGRPMLLDFGSHNCTYCVKLDATTFRDPSITRLLNERFIPVKIDANRELGLTQSLGIRSYPTLVFAAPDGKIMGKQEGYIEPAPLGQALQRVVAALPRRAPQDAVVGTPRPEAPVMMRQVRLTITPPEPASAERPRLARDLLAGARADYEARLYLGCLERCDQLTERFADLPEATEAQKLVAAIRADSEATRAAHANLARLRQSVAQTSPAPKVRAQSP